MTPSTNGQARPGDVAASYLQAGLSVVPIRDDGTKSPTVAWAPYQKRLPTSQELQRWFVADNVGVAVIFGQVSGGAEVIDIDDAEFYQPFCDAVESLQPGLIGRLTHIRTPRPGYHIMYRCEVVQGNQKLAFVADGNGRKCAIETRGQGGYALVPGSPGTCHETGRLYEHVSGPPLTELPRITREERDILFLVARSYDEYPAENEHAGELPPTKPRDPSDGLLPGDDFSQRADWDDILTPHGWTKAHTGAGKTHWRRPGKTHGWSATTGCKSQHGNQLFCCFSHNAHPFEGGTKYHDCSTYTKFAAYALLNHGGDFTAAAKQLASEGYGDAPKRRPGMPDLRPADLRDDAGQTHTQEAETDGGVGLTDVGNGQRFARQYGHCVRYSFAWDKWFCFNGRRWMPDADGEVYRLAKQTAQSIYSEAANARDRNESKQVANWAHQSQARYRLASMLEMAKSEKPIPLDYKTLDQDGWLLNCENGTVDLKTGELRDHDAGDFITMTTGVVYPESPTRPTRWLQFIGEIFEGNADLIAFVKRLCGVALVGHVYEHILPLAYGVGSNGKSVLCETLQSALGDYAMAAPQGMLLVKRFQAHSTEICGLFRKRLVIASETDDGARLNEGLVKSLTGGERIRARRMREDYWEFDPTHTLLFASNHKPVVKGRDVGIWRRLRIIPFNARIADERQDKHLAEKFRAEFPAILRWMVEGCLEWQEGGLQEPQEVLLATEGYKADQDVIGAFIDDRCMVGAGYQVKSKDIYQAYRSWCEQSGENIENSRKFKAAMEERGFEYRKNNTTWVVGITLS